jgi:acetyltransferase-like isoleucine patch superfamily enzyme
MPAWLYEYGRAFGSFLLLCITAALLGVAMWPSALGVQYMWEHYGMLWGVFTLPFGFGIWGLCYALLVIAIKWLSFSRFKPGTYDFASWTTVRWVAIGFLALTFNEIFGRCLIGSPLLNWWFSALGAKIGRRVAINTIIVSDWDMITIDDDVFVGGRATVIGHAGEMNQLKFAPVHIGKKCSIGQETAIFPGVTMEDGAVVGGNSLVPKHTKIGANEIWGGVPAHFIKMRGEKDGPSQAPAEPATTSDETAPAEAS